MAGLQKILIVSVGISAGFCLATCVFSLNNQMAVPLNFDILKPAPMGVAMWIILAL